MLNILLISSKLTSDVKNLQILPLHPFNHKALRNLYGDSYSIVILNKIIKEVQYLVSGYIPEKYKSG